MCELFAMSSLHAATVDISLTEFSRHGGRTDNHKDGWGIAYYRDRDALVIREPTAAADSAQMQFVREQDFASTLVISHIRKATMGELALRNTQPFARELGGRLHVFAHNGMLPEVASRYPLAGPCHPIGETDSEYAFCVLMARLARIWVDPGKPPGLDERVTVIADFAMEMAELGPANFIYSDSDFIIAHGHRRSHPDGIHPPGLYWLCRTCRAEPRPISVPGLDIRTDAESQEIALLASVPLSDEAWTPMQEGELVVLESGRIIRGRM
jgi:predicted glutamine amidotransferase